MSAWINLVLTLCLIICAIIDDCDAEAKAKRGRTRNNRRCPSACLRKIRQLEKKPGPTGPPGPPGRPGNPAPKGPSLKLPVCKSGEYLTSDGNNLICEKLNLDGVCASLAKSCPIDDKDPNKVVQPTAKVPGRMVKFMKKNMFQTISTDAWDIEVFTIDNSLFFGLSQLGLASFQIYKWYTDSFKHYQKFKVMNARNWSPFQIGNDHYFVVATYMGKTCPIFRYNSGRSTFEKQSTGIECRETVDLKPFQLNSEQHIVVANHADGQPVVIWKWDGKKFVKRQEIDITATYVEVFDVNGDKFIAISGSETRGPYVFVYKWDGKKFVSFQNLYTIYRPYQVAAFEAGQEKFLSVALMGSSESTESDTKTNNLFLMKWNGNKFESFQNITAYGLYHADFVCPSKGETSVVLSSIFCLNPVPNVYSTTPVEARRITAMSSPLMGKETTYLAVINTFKEPEIYYWVGDSSTKFEKLQEIEATSARDVCFFEMGRDLYMLVSSHNRISIFRGGLV